MSVGTTTSLNAIFKRNYDAGSRLMTEQQNLYAPFHKSLKVDPLRPTPQGAYMLVNMSGNEAGGAINETQAYEQVQSENPQNPYVVAKQMSYPFAATSRSIELSKGGNAVAFLSSLATSQKGKMARAYADIERQAFGTGTGQISLVNGAVTASTTVVVDNAIAFRRGMVLDGWTAIAGTKEMSGVPIAAVNIPTSTLTMAAAVTLSDNAILVKSGILDGVTSGANAKEINGVLSIVDTTTYSSTFEGLSVTTNPEWQGIVVANSPSAPISQDLLLRTLDQIVIIGNGMPTKLVSNRGQQRVFLNQELQKTRYEPGTVKAGATVLKWNDLEWMSHYLYPLDELAMLDMEQLSKFETRDLHIADADGLQIIRKDGYAIYAGNYEYFGNMGTAKRNAHGRLTGLTIPTF